MVTVLTGLIGMAVSAMIFFLVRKDKLHVNHAVGWIFVAGACTMLGFAPDIFDQLANKIGIAYPPALALTLGIAFLTIKIVSIDIERSRAEVRTQRLVQRIAILETELRSFREKENIPTTS